MSPRKQLHDIQQVTSPPWNSKEIVWASRWSVALPTFYRQILSLLYSFFCFWNFRPRLARLYLYDTMIWCLRCGNGWVPPCPQWNPNSWAKCHPYPKLLAHHYMTRPESWSSDTANRAIRLWLVPLSVSNHKNVEDSMCREGRPKWDCADAATLKTRLWAESDSCFFLWSDGTFAF